MRIKAFIFLLVFSFPSVKSIIGQSVESKLNIALMAAIDQNGPDEHLTLAVSGDLSAIERFVAEKNGICRLYAGWASVTLQTKWVKEFSFQPFVSRIEYDLQHAIPLNDSMLVNNNVLPVINQDSGLIETYDGSGVIIGFIDTGLDFLHPDFQDTLGNTRVLKIWDQGQDTLISSRIPTYGYGQVWDSTDINSGNCTHDDDIFSHGTNVSGVAVSNGNATGQFRGVAPEAHIIAVASNFSSSNWLATVVDAVEWIFLQADAYDMPCVINISAGDYLGSHDALDPYAIAIDSMIQAKRGRVVTCAAGNAGNSFHHLGYDVDSDTSFTWFEYNGTSALGYGSVYFRLWADTADFNQVQFAVGADKVSGGYAFRGHTPFDNISNRLNMLVSDTLKSVSGNVLGVVDTYAEESDGRYFLEVHMAQPDSNQYAFRFMTTGSGHFDVWSAKWLGISDMVKTGLPTVVQFPDIANYKQPDTLMTMVSSFTCLPSVITVANYVNRNEYLDVNSVVQTFPDVPGEIADNSSLGPTRSLLQKPDIAASGAITLSANRLASIPLHVNNGQSDRIALGGFHKRNGGTSMACPVVSGLAGLYLQKCPNADFQEIQNAIVNTAKQDTFTSSVLPDPTWGYGKADVYQALLESSYVPDILPSNQLDVCEGDSIEISGEIGFESYWWSSGDSGIAVTAFGDYTNRLYVSNNAGCLGTDSVSVTERALPDKPTVTTFIGGLESSIADAYQWYENGQLLPGETNQQLLIAGTGYYQVEVFNTFLCSSISDSTFYTTISELNVLQTSRVFPNPSDQKLIVESSVAPTQNVELNLYDVVGQKLMSRVFTQRITLNVSDLENGHYLLELRSAGESKQFNIIIAH